MGQYVGLWQNGSFVEGSVTLGNQDRYEGAFHENVLNGAGTLVTTRSGADSVYSGQFMKGLAHGVGKVTFGGNGSSYEGLWSEGHMHGEGRLTTSRRDEFTGDFHQSKMHGKGKVKWSSGEVSLTVSTELVVS